MPRKAVMGAGAAAAVLLLSGCSQGIENGALPSTPEITNQTGRIITLWNGSWIAALVVGVITWGLILWCVAVYRKRKGDNKLPVQTRVHLPLELMYTIVPIIAIGVLFKYTAEDIAFLTDTSAEPDVEIQVVGKQWSWDFNYLTDDVFDPGVQAQLTGEEGVEETLPTLYLPVNETVHFYLDSRDVIHSFWIPAFLYKEDTVPGRQNEWQVTPTQTGTYQGKCAELCGEYHASMLFNVKVVERDEYDAHMQELADKGYEGALGLEYSRDQVVEFTMEHGETE
ncbi:cytochrome c oxidase subunit II [Demequina sp. NBRC 110051]|uniref:aa3-type cytochrome oxidase subunit II n=1 Tax=Demequina sp. NBRC 110051 TaxID=1570340 RepID=UPI000A079C02|nr:cytochrome c oxidase subunit II [Demequina sp. NBRC 110051]